jgi:hypothetical protein
MTLAVLLAIGVKEKRSEDGCKDAGGDEESCNFRIFGE